MSPGDSPAPGPQLTFCFLLWDPDGVIQRARQRWAGQAALPPRCAGLAPRWPEGETEAHVSPGGELMRRIHVFSGELGGGAVRGHAGMEIGCESRVLVHL